MCQIRIAEVYLHHTAIVSKHKIINDPIYGFIEIDDPLMFRIMEHPHFQRLRRIKQLGMTDLVYPGATHSRFHHAIGAMHLMRKAISVLRSKKIDITQEEAQGVLAAILLHDIGHGPFSHTLEGLIVPIAHERISLALMRELNREFEGQLDLAISIFQNTYSKKFLHQLVSSQLDMDRLDYLTRDSFYTGVSEGIVGLERIIQMLNVVDDRLVVEEKGIYSIEKFIVARRLMYWQVYLHKTTLAADAMLLNILKRVKAKPEEALTTPISESLRYFAQDNADHGTDGISETSLKHFVKLDDHDLIAAIKGWISSSDPILSFLCKSLINRDLFKVQMFKNAPDSDLRTSLMRALKEQMAFVKNDEDASYLMSSGSVRNEAYADNGPIDILMKDGSLLDIAKASDNYSISALRTQVEKYYFCTVK